MILELLLQKYYFCSKGKVQLFINLLVCVFKGTLIPINGYLDDQFFVSYWSTFGLSWAF